MSDKKSPKIVKKLVCILVSAGIGAGVTAGHFVASSKVKNERVEKENKRIEFVDDSIEKTLVTLNLTDLTKSKIVKITDVETIYDENDKTNVGSIKLSTEGVNARGTSFDCSFTFTGEKTDVVEIDDIATELFVSHSEELKKSAEELQGTETMQLVIDYTNKISDFVKENKKSCVYSKETLSTETLTDSDGVAYEGKGVLDRAYEYLSQGGLSSKDAADKWWEEIKDYYKTEDLKCNNSIVVDVTNQTATASTQLGENKFFITVKVPVEKITSTDPEQIKADISSYVLEVLKKTTAEAKDDLSNITSADMGPAVGQSIWTSVNELSTIYSVTEEASAEI